MCPTKGEIKLTYFSLNLGSININALDIGKLR